MDSHTSFFWPYPFRRLVSGLFFRFSPFYLEHPPSLFAHPISPSSKQDRSLCPLIGELHRREVASRARARDLGFLCVRNRLNGLE